MDIRCVDCIRRNFVRLSQKFCLSETEQVAFFARFSDIAYPGSRLTAPEAQRELLTFFQEITGNNDPFAREKAYSNEIASIICNEWKPQILKSQDPFGLALRFALAGNVMDFAANASFDINQTIYQALTSTFSVDHSSELKKRIAKAKRILFLGDNAGEIVFDRLFIEIIRHPSVTYAVRGSFVLNDVTEEDARQTDMCRVARVINSGYNAPSTLLKNCSKAFLNEYKNADLIISKGQGNLEGVMNENDPRVFFLLMIKCDMMAEKLNIEKGSFVVINSTIHAGIN